MTECPCGSDMALQQCCQPILDNPTSATTAEALMRSRYTAHLRAAPNHLWVTWHPRTRPDDISDIATDWTALQVVSTEQGTPGDEVGTVEYRATRPGQVLHEVARFARRAGRWFYVDGDLL